VEVILDVGKTLRAKEPKNLRAGLVSIGVPVYNGAQYLRGALESLLAQDYANVEFIISDNASDDDTEAICQEFAIRDLRVRYYRAEENRGPFWNYIRVYELARGEYFMWAAHDDLRHPRYLSQCVAELERNPKALFCCTGAKFIDAEGRDVTEAAGMKTFRPVGATPRDRLRALARSTFWFDIYSLFRTPTIAQTTLGRLVWGGDILIVSQLCLRGEVALVPEQLFFYRYLKNKTGEKIVQSLDPSGSLYLSWIHLTIEVLRSIATAPLGAFEKLEVAWTFTSEFCWRNNAVNNLIRKESFNGVRHEFAHRRYLRALAMAGLLMILIPTNFFRRASASARYRLGRLRTRLWGEAAVS
jgi:glycosyltransferase involved in cell wall biosynthesis